MLRVMDTGIGIPEDELAKVTQVFVQGNLAVARKHAGAGLGLPLAKHLVELHGGRLTLDSAVQLGTTVTIWLPPSRLVTEAELAASTD
jgi:signal transduction histidine kinase